MNIQTSDANASFRQNNVGNNDQFDPEDDIPLAQIATLQGLLDQTNNEPVAADDFMQMNNELNIEGDTSRGRGTCRRES